MNMLYIGGEIIQCDSHPSGGGSILAWMQLYNMGWFYLTSSRWARMCVHLYKTTPMGWRSLSFVMAND